MPAWLAMVGQGASALGSGLSSDSAAQSSIEGAQAAYDNEIKRIALTKELDAAERERQAPFMQLGTQGLQNINAARSYNADYATTPEYQFRAGLINQAIADNAARYGGEVSPYVGSLAAEGMPADEEAGYYDRQLDAVRIGQGQAAQAGLQSTQYGNSLAAARMAAGNAMAAGMNASAGIRDSMYKGLGNSAAGIPAHVYNQRTNDLYSGYNPSTESSGRTWLRTQNNPLGLTGGQGL